MSDSIGDAARRKALEFITTSAAGKPEADRVGMVVFGASAAVELPPRQSFPFEVINARVPTDGRHRPGAQPSRARSSTTPPPASCSSATAPRPPGRRPRRWSSSAPAGFR
ncbi:MAG: hypothetical protein U1F87_06930 [Kiritimatiellia bacterium]